MAYRSFTYHFKTGSGDIHTYTHTIGEALEVKDPSALPEWQKLGFNQCKGCQWEKTSYCPVAVRLDQPASLLGLLNSYEPIEVMVEGPERTYHKKTTAQDGLSALFGLIMGSSECPAFSSFKGLAWFHMPFSSFEETLFRALSGMLLRNHLNRKLPDESAILAEISAIYAQIREVNIGITNRLRKGVSEYTDSPLNAIVILDTFGQLVTMSVDDGMKELKKIFGIGASNNPPQPPSGSPATPLPPSKNPYAKYSA